VERRDHHAVVADERGQLDHADDARQIARPPATRIRPRGYHGLRMDLASVLKVGRKGSAALTVAPEHTAPHVGSGRVPVLATPVVINLLEAAALAAVEHLLPEGHQSLGVQLDVRHFAATPVGMRVEAEAELLAVDGRMLTFRVSASDEREPISEGTHERVVVNVARFDRRMEAKARGA